MRILLTNNTLALHAGTEMVVRDVALRLKELGHEPMCFTLDPGPVAEMLQAAGVLVVDDLTALPAVPEVIHGHHLVETTLAAMHFPRIPVISFCHGSAPWQEAPCRLPNVRRWVAVDRVTLRRLTETEGLPAEQVVLMWNAVDTRRFRVRAPLPARPRRALVFSNTAKESTHIPVIRTACAARGIALEVAGAGAGKLTRCPEQLLPEFDLVFAKARAAMEAMAVGCAVIQADYFGAGHLVTTARFDALREMNFGLESMTHPLTTEHLLAEMDAYDPAEAARVRDRIRGEGSLDDAMGKLLRLYETVRCELVPAFSPAVEAHDFLRVLASLGKRYFGEIKRAPDRVLHLPLPLSKGQSVHDQIDAAIDGHETQAARAERLRTERRNTVERLAAAKAELAAAKGPKLPVRGSALRRWWRSLTGKQSP
ncbi:MAG: glycosyltransferase [Verrucomicrobiales bacterium]|nr:glycosyltransferase [Verrucomicrobiales bacterium]